MKNMLRIASLVLALMMVFAVTAFAEGETGSITINDAVVGQTYTIYQILDLESYNASANAYAYKATTAWNTFISSEAIKGTYVEVDAQGYVTWKESADAAAFAKAAQKYAKDNSITNQGSVTATTTTVSFTGLDLGYYLVDTTLGTLCSLDTTNPNVVMEEKNEVPVNVKTVEEDSTGKYGEKNDADIGQTVNFKSTITAQAGAENYVFHDTMSAGLTYTGVTGVTLNGTAVDASNNYTVVTDGLADGCTFEVRFTQAFCDTLKANDQIVISYTATLNENAVIAGEGNPNTSKVSYGDSSNTKYTPDSQTKTYTWDVDVFKYTMNGETETALAGATFTLSKNTDGSNPITLISKGNNVYRVAKTGETGTVTEITTDATGKFTIAGLDADTYYLTETAAPAGYNKLAGPVTVVIGENGVVNATTEASQGVDEVKVLNQTGTELPSTGGIGTTIFYVVGGVLVVGAVALLIVRRRRNA
ncbi:MAG: SpaH/EbpB family LPXTG-anchored major pilin [Clostridiales bacterium]|nr:SpaH/EbpB family LPXTG-anchored major pilin [Clostridiales bacterium]MDY5349480.1 SpaH/EbpB family LPXTG-anchored major pilin [Candidatus Ventricola sp.]MDY5514435.1 SpaH/EbpB family LPXTG-anchored major pilin [Candidatus Ventricola sp.]